MADKLFNEPAKGEIVVTDSQGNTKSVAINKLKFRASAYGVLIENNKILVQHNPLISRYDIPGGGIELGETIAHALEREFVEETGLQVKITKLIDVRENFFAFTDEYAHGILIFYDVERVGGNLLVNGNGEDTDKIEFVDIAKLDTINLVPLFKDVLKKHLF